jgi:excisionase family DNA binding protein
MSKEVLTTKEASEYLRITRPTLLKLIREGEIKVQKVGHNYRFLKSELERYLKVGSNNEVQSR